MNCPRDGTGLTRATLGGIELDKCPQCDGIWFDRNEMETLRDAGLSHPEQQVHPTAADPQLEKAETKGFMRCPRCDDARLQGCTYTYLNPVRIDRCESCFGVWLDKGELDAIIGEKQQLQAPSGKLRSLMQSLARTLAR